MFTNLAIVWGPHIVSMMTLGVNMGWGDFLGHSWYPSHPSLGANQICWRWNRAEFWKRKVDF